MPHDNIEITENNIVSFHNPDFESYSVYENLLDSKMNLHIGVPGNSNIFWENNVLNLLPYIPNNASSVMFVGTRFGGPEKTLLEHRPDLKLTCLVTSEFYYNYLLQNPIPNTTIYYMNPSDWESKEFFDAVISIQYFGFVSDDFINTVNTSVFLLSDMVVAQPVKNMLSQEAADRKTMYLPSIGLSMRSERRWYKIFNSRNFNIHLFERYDGNICQFFGSVLPFYQNFKTLNESVSSKSLSNLQTYVFSIFNTLDTNFNDSDLGNLHEFYLNEDIESILPTSLKIVDYVSLVAIKD